MDTYMYIYIPWQNDCGIIQNGIFTINDWVLLGEAGWTVGKVVLFRLRVFFRDLNERYTT
jgi:hypothetical protein